MTTEFYRCVNLLLCVFFLVIVIPADSLSAATSAKNKRKPAKPFVISYISFSDDSFYQKQRAYTGVTLKQNKRPLNGVKLGIKGSRIIGRSMGMKFELAEHSVLSDDDFAGQIARQLIEDKSVAAILDLPKDAMLKVAAELSGKPVVLFNVRHKNDALRGSQCHGQIFHTLPSQAMLMDAMNQYLKSRSWEKVLLLTGPSEDDVSMSESYKKSARKFAIKIVSEKNFVLGNDPRDRSKTNISLLTSSPKHDVVFVADTLGEFARYVPYQTHHSRLVAGSEGLVADAWHWSWERHGAPQLNQRFRKKFDDDMSVEQWAGWVAVKSLVSAAKLAKSTEHGKLIAALSSQDLILDLYKGGAGNFRSWNNQLRQPVLLHTHNAVQARAPLDGFLHHRNTLDTLGIDEIESDCVW